ncbi:MAG: hypothetical protein V3S40_05465 [Kiloniellales bacterium]|jgi:hypothetical protein
MATLASRFSWWHAPNDAEQIDRRELCAGATFARTTRTQVTETARILSVAEEEWGIPHVRYHSRLHSADRTLEQGQRTLALPSFLNRFESVPQRHATGRAGVERRALHLP